MKKYETKQDAERDLKNLVDAVTTLRVLENQWRVANKKNFVSAAAQAFKKANEARETVDKMILDIAAPAEEIPKLFSDLY